MEAAQSARGMRVRGDDSVDVTAARRLHGLIGRLNAERDLESTVQAVVDGVVAGVGFGVAALYYRLAEGGFEALAVAGPTEARAAVLRQRLPADAFDLDFAHAQSWGALRFVPHDRFVAGMVTHWVPTAEDTVAADGGPEPWHPLDALFVPLHGAGGQLTGVLSVDCPADGRRPEGWRRALLEIFASHAAIAIDNARVAQDLQEEHRRLRRTEEALRLAFDGSHVAMAMLSMEPEQLGRYLRVNQALCDLTGYTAAELLTRRAVDITHPDDAPADLRAAAEALAGKRDSYHAEKRYLRADGSTVWVAVSTTAVGRDSDQAPRGITVIEDITARRALEQDLEHRASHDPLTGLLNQRALRQRITEALQRTRRTSRTGAVLFCDLDGFKTVNDHLGHQHGDTVLTAVAQRLTAQVRVVDTVARFGGDEFVILAEELHPADVTSLADRLERSVAEPLPGVDTGGLTISIGIAMFTETTADPDSLLNEADLAMYGAKARGRNGHLFFHDLPPRR